MQKHSTIKNHQQEIQLIFQRTMIALVVICLLSLTLIIRLAYLQIYMHDVYSTLSAKNCLDMVPVEPTRGLIYDRNGVLLAENISVFSLDVIPFKVVDLNKTLNSLGKIVVLSEDDVNQFKKQLRQHRRFDEIPLKLKLTDKEVATFTENQQRFPGVLIKARLMRHYPYGETFSHVVGNVGRINTEELSKIDTTNYSASHYIGKLGIEKYYEEVLHGKVGYEQVENDASGKPIRVLNEIKGEPGKNLYLTLDNSLQQIVEKAMGNYRGAVVVMEPSTGQVLAMVSRPEYDPNLFVTGINQKDYQALRDSPTRPLYDRALRGLYPLASTIKPYLALEGLESGIADTEFTLFDQGWFKLPNSSHVFHDWVRQGHGTVNLAKAIMVSCDIYFYELAYRLGIARIDDILNQFGFGSVTGIDLDDELPGVVSSPEWKRKVKGEHWYMGDTIISSIGQGDMQATPLQLATAVSTIANRGQRFIPNLLLGEQMPGGKYTAQNPIPLESIQLKNKKNWEVIINAMENVIASPQGTAYSAFGHGQSYTVAAKTGTGAVSRRRNPNEKDKQEQMPENLRDHNIFIAFAPVDKPKIALAIVTEHSHVAAEIARNIFDYYLENKIPDFMKKDDDETKKDNKQTPTTQNGTHA